MKVERSAILKFNKNDDIDNWFIYHEILSALDKYPDHVFYIDNYRIDGTVEVFQGIETLTLTAKILSEEYNKSKTDPDPIVFKNSKTMYESSVKPDCSKLIAVYVNRHQLRLQPGFYAGYYDTHDKEWKVINNDVREEFNDEQISWWTELEFDFNKKDDDMKEEENGVT